MSVNDKLIDNLEIPGIRKMNYSIFGYCLYLGIERTISSKYVKLVNFGIEATKRRKTDSENYLIRTKSNEKWNSIGQELVSEYLDRNISLGLRLAVGLWR